MAAEEQGLYGRALELRLPALERCFGKHKEYLVSPIPFYLGGGPTLVGFPNAVPGATVYCTSEMTGGWGSEQKPGPYGEYELVMVVETGGVLAPHVEVGEGARAAKMGHVGSLLSDLAKYSRTAKLLPGETIGPVHPNLSPMTNAMFVDLTSAKKPFEFGGARYGLLLVVLIDDAEFDLCQRDGSAAVIERMRAAKTYPVSSLTRASVA
jgi:hypothetical protein